MAVRILIRQLYFSLPVTAIVLIAAVTAFTSVAAAAEPICPGGASPRADISWCADFEGFGNPACQSGAEAECATINKLSGTSGIFTIGGGDAAVGTGAISGGGEPGGTGPGFSTVELPSASTSASLRFYVKFKNGYMQSYWSRGNHGPAIEATDGSCFVRLTLDWFADGPSFATNGTCAPGGGSPLPNNLVPEIPMKNNRWYLVEMQTVLNTSSGAGTYNGNGVFRAWIDGVKIMEHTNLNIRGSSSASIRSLMPARSYYGVGTPSWQPHIAYDNFAYSSTGAFIGPAAGENARGAGDPLSPYVNWTAYNALTGKRTAGDCSTPSGELGVHPNSYKWRNGSDILQASVVHRGYVTTCPATPDKALLAAAPTDTGAGIAIPLSTPANIQRLVIHGWVNLPPTNDYNAATILSGWARYGPNAAKGGSNDWGLQFGFGVVGGKWSLIQHGPSGVAVIPAPLTATFNSWHEFEIHITKSNRASLMIDRSWLFDEVPMSQPIADWAWDGSSAGPRSIVVGIIDHRGSGTFQAYLDDIDSGSASYWSCKGWSAESCPLTGNVPRPLQPAAPTGVTAKIVL